MGRLDFSVKRHHLRSQWRYSSPGERIKGIVTDENRFTLLDWIKPPLRLSVVDKGRPLSV